MSGIECVMVLYPISHWNFNDDYLNKLIFDMFVENSMEKVETDQFEGSLT